MGQKSVTCGCDKVTRLQELQPQLEERENPDETRTLAEMFPGLVSAVTAVGGLGGFSPWTSARRSGRLTAPHARRRPALPEMSNLVE